MMQMQSNSSPPKQKQKFQVIVRIKPFREEDRELYALKQMENILKFNSSVITIRKPIQQKAYNFNRVFYNEPQEEVFRSAEHLIPEMFEGYNATFLAYGQTGTGKTHTVFGSKQAVLESAADNPDAGIFYRCAARIFEEIQQRMQGRQFNVRVSFLEFYLDNIYDLLADDPKFNKKVELKETPKEGVIIKDLTEVSVRSFEELVNVLKKPIRNRKTQSTTINRNSSRSHALIQICLRQRWRSIEDGVEQTKERKGLLKIVDLAGSERVSKTESEGTRLEEAKRINKQITTLGKCIEMLVASERSSSRSAEGLDKFNLKVHVPFRDTKLTRFLADSLDGRSRIVLCVCISNFVVHSEETFSSLLFASKAMMLKIDPRRNQQYLAKAIQQPKSHTPTKINPTSSIDSFHTPNKLLRETTNSNEGSRRDFNQSVEREKEKSAADAGVINRLKEQIRLIDAQVQGNFQDMNLESVDREKLEQAVRMFSGVIQSLQSKLQKANQKILEYEQSQRYSRY